MQVYTSSSFSEYYHTISLNLIHINCLNPSCKVASVNAETEPYDGIQDVLVSINEYLAYLRLQLILFYLPCGLCPQRNFLLIWCMYSLFQITWLIKFIQFKAIERKVNKAGISDPMLASLILSLIKFTMKTPIKFFTVCLIISKVIHASLTGMLPDNWIYESENKKRVLLIGALDTRH